MDLSNLPLSSNIDDQRTDIEKLLDNDNFSRAPALWDRLKDEDTMLRPNSRVADSFLSLLPGAQGVPQSKEQLAASKPLAALYDRGGNEKFADIKSLIDAARPYVAQIASKPGAFSSAPADANGPPVAVDKRDLLARYKDHVARQQPQMSPDQIFDAQNWQPQEAFAKAFRPEGWDAFLEGAPQSTNVDDRRQEPDIIRRFLEKLKPQ